MNRPLRPATVLVLLSAVLFTACASTGPLPVPPQDLPKMVVPATSRSTYTRCFQTEPDTYLLQTGRRVFTPASGRGPTVELLGTAHIGETAYYAALQQRMDQADAVLYELVTDEERPVDPLTPDASAKLLTRSVYYKLAKLLGLVPQKACIRYDRRHFHRCDMTIQQMQALLQAELAAGGKDQAEAKRAGSQFSSLSKVLRGRSWLVNFGLLAAELLPGIKAQLKFSLVVSTPRMQEEKSPTSRLTKLINADRNAHVLRELPKFIASHPKVKHLVIFYGSAHLPGMAQGLRERGYHPAGPILWLTAARSHPMADGLNPREIHDTLDKARKTSNPSLPQIRD